MDGWLRFRWEEEERENEDEDDAQKYEQAASAEGRQCGRPEGEVKEPARSNAKTSKHRRRCPHHTASRPDLALFFLSLSPVLALLNDILLL